MSGGVVVDAVMQPAVVLDDHFSERAEEIRSDIRVGVLVDRHRSRGVRRKHAAQTAFGSGFRNDAPNVIGYVQYLIVRRGSHLKCLLEARHWFALATGAFAALFHRCSSGDGAFAVILAEIA